MKIYYSKSANGFYIEGINTDIPADAVEITQEQHQTLLKDQAGGKLIRADADGYPESYDPETLLTVEEVRARKITALAGYRYALETGGITVGGNAIATDRESQAMIAGAKLYSDLDETNTFDWKGSGGWITIGREAILTISQAVAAHVEACFSNERYHSEAIAVLTTSEEIAAYDYSTGWPV